MRKRKKEFSIMRHIRPFNIIIVIIIIIKVILLNFLVELSNGLFLMSANCLAGSPGCNCMWKSGKFVADCSQQNLTRVPKNDHFDFMLASAGNNQMPTLNRDIQQLNLSSNNISNLGDSEFIEKKFRNLQKVYLNGNQLLHIHSNAFYKLTGLIELDLSENMITSFISSNSIEEEDEVTRADHDKVSVHLAKVNNNNNNKQQNTETNLNNNITRSIKSVSSKSFLKDLAQLRVLNMNSNSLTRCDKFTFSPLVQLRQLFLSSGNKLSHLDGGILLKLPQLHAIQLAGSNQWNCDCKLRKLMRQLTLDEHGERVHKEERSLIQLQDEPMCSEEDQTGGRTMRSWKNMTFADLQCPPRLAEQFLVVEEKLSKNVAQLNSIKEDQNSKLFRLESVHLVLGEPLELTCAVELNDKLEAQEQTLEWWQLETQSSKLPLKLWSSSSSSNKTFLSNSDRFAVIDYVTRANSTRMNRMLTATLNQSKAIDTDDHDDDDDKDEADEELIRVSHLVGGAELLMNEIGQLVYLCRVTNKFNASSTLDLIYPISVDLHSSRIARARSEARADLRQMTSSSTLPAISPSFTPLHLPAGLTADELSDSPTSLALDLISRGPQHTRPAGPATRQINATLRNSTSHQHLQAEQQTRLLLNRLTLALVTRFSSNQAHLIRPPLDLSTDTSDTGSKEGYAGQVSHVPPSWHIPPSTSNRLTELLNVPLSWVSHQLMALDKSSSTSSTPIILLLAGLCAGLFVGCLLTLGLALRFRSHRVASSSSAQLAATKPGPPLDSPKLSPHTPPGTHSPSTLEKSPQLDSKKMKDGIINEPLWLVASEGDEADAEDELAGNNELELCLAHSPANCQTQVTHLNPVTRQYLTLRQTKPVGSSRRQERMNNKLQLNEIYTSNDSSSTILLPINENHHQHHDLCTSLMNSNCQYRSSNCDQPYENYTTGAHLMRRSNLNRKMHSSSVTSPAASTSSTSLTPMTNNQQLSLNQPTLHDHLYAHNENDSTNLVYLEDALQLLQHSMNDCVLFERNNMDEEQHRL